MGIAVCNRHNCLLLALHGDSKKQLFADHRNHQHAEKGTNEMTVENGKVAKSKDVNQMLFYRDLMDAAHCYLVHGIDVGLRIKTLDNVKKEKHQNGGCGGDVEAIGDSAWR